MENIYSITDDIKSKEILISKNEHDLDCEFKMEITEETIIIWEVIYLLIKLNIIKYLKNIAKTL
jgi:hypothetical protein